MKQPSLATYLFVFTGIFFAFFHFNLAAQSIPFVPPVYNYTSNTYNAGNQNWAIAQGKDGVMYFGNNNGMLSFDGSNWALHTLPNNLGVKSILVDTTKTDERIYVGSFEEFGYFEKNAANQLIYYSLKPLVKEHVFKNDEIWTIRKHNNDVFFQTFSSYFVYNKNNAAVKSFVPIPGPLYFFTVNNALFAQSINENFYKFDDAGFKPVLTKEQLKNDVVVSVLPFKQKLLLLLSGNGAFEYDEHTGELSEWKTEITPQLHKTTINRSVVLPDSTYIIGTLNDGVYALDANGKLKWHLDRNNGLNNNTVLGVFADRESNLWVALDNGISYIQTNSPISFFEPANIQIGLVEDMLSKNGAFYVATNQGIYKYSDVARKIFPLPGFEIQSWFIKEFDSQIIVGNNKGTSFLVNDQNVPITGSSTGGMDIKQVRLHNEDVLLESTYTTLQVYRKTNGRWVFSNKIEGFLDLINQIEVDHTGNIWAGHMYKGVYRLRTNRELEKITDKVYYSSLDSVAKKSTRIKMMKLNGRIIFADELKFYTYDDISQRIIPFDQLNNDLQGMADARRVIAVNDSVFWFVRNNEYTLVKYNRGHYAIQDKIPFITLNNPPNKERGNIYVDEKGISYFCMNGGIGKYSPSQNTPENEKRLTLSGVLNFDRKNNYKEFLSLHAENIIPYAHNNLSLKFQYPDFSKKTLTVECFLEGYDSQWVPVTNMSANYLNLPAGNYVLKARALNDSGVELSTLRFLFHIKNPWYKTGWAYVLYIVMILLVAGFIIHKYLNRVIQKKNRFFAQQEKERIAQLDRQEKMITELKNKQLETDLTHKSKELANATMLIINHEELLNKIKANVQKNVLDGKMQRSPGNELLKMIDHNLSDEDEWAVFQENFDLIHENFFRKLKQNYSALTSADLRLCALLRLNYSSKEIARMLNLSVRGVEAARYRLRKKLDLNEKEDLVTFMINFK
ncbi:MAG: triple tyrosine motif-containing protein [Petrimonas sp.]|nr:triple tyrosine motif-containing protein [Petrimonas sp.]